MRKALVVAVLALAVSAVAQDQKVIKDATEYHAYMAALNMADAAQKGPAMEAFIKQYPNSIVKVDALEQAMAAYQQAGNAAKVLEMASALVQSDPNNVRALAILAAIKRGQAGTPAAAAEVRAIGEKGLSLLPSWSKPAGASAEEFEKVRQQMTVIFAGACGFGALQAKDYAAASACYQKSLAVDPNNMLDSYQLGIAFLEMKPLDVRGFWYVGKALSLAQGNPPAINAITPYSKAKYKRYHGGEDGWDALVARTAKENAPPSGFTVKPAPTEAELAVIAVKENDPATLSFADREFILSYRDASPANKEAAEKVWASIQAVQKGGAAKLKMPIKVISATKDTISGALTEENQKDNKPDVKITMEKPMLRPPAAGAMIDVIGVITGYTPQPFLFTMEQGELPAAAAKPPVKPPARRRR